MVRGRSLCLKYTCKFEKKTSPYSFFTTLSQSTQIINFMINERRKHVVTVFNIILLFDLNLCLTQSIDKVGVFLILSSLTTNRNQLRTEGPKFVLLEKILWKKQRVCS